MKFEFGTLHRWATCRCYKCLTASLCYTDYPDDAVQIIQIMHLQDASTKRMFWKVT